MIRVSHPYFPMQGAQEYLAYSIRAKFDPKSGKLELMEAAVPLPVSDHKRHYVPMDGPMPWTAMVYTPLGGALPMNWRDSCYGSIQGWGSAPGGKGFVGEMGEFTEYFTPGTTANRYCHLFQQPEPELPVDVGDYKAWVDVPVLGNRYHKDTGEVVAISCPSRFKNLGPGPLPGGVWWWGQFPNQLLTCLMERPDTFDSEDIYNYCWAKGVGLLSAAWIRRERDNTGRGYMFQLRTP